MGGVNARRELLEYAYEHCPFYKELYDCRGFHPSMLKNDEDWEKVPVLEKWMIREHGDRMFSDIVDRKTLGRSTTGGSTGKPLVVWKQKDVFIEVLAWRAIKWYGVEPWMNEGIVHRRVPTSFVGKLKNRAMWWPTRRAYLSAKTISDAELSRFTRELQRKDIKWIQGYCASLEYVADYILAHDINITCVKMIWSTSSPLTDIVRKKMERAFHCPVMDQYGCCEMGNIACQKPKEDCLTVHNDYVWVDIVDGDKPCKKGELGDVCITDLRNFAFPLIKYRLGDRSRLLKGCEETEDGCQKIAFVKGRISDMLDLPNGDVLDGAYLTTIFDNHYKNVSCFQIHQTKDYNVVLKVVPTSNTPENIKVIEGIAEELRSLVKNVIEIKLEITDKIEDFAGKRKYIISDIALSKLK